MLLPNGLQGLSFPSRAPRRLPPGTHASITNITRDVELLLGTEDLEKPMTTQKIGSFHVERRFCLSCPDAGEVRTHTRSTSDEQPVVQSSGPDFRVDERCLVEFVSMHTCRPGLQQPADTTAYGARYGDPTDKYAAPHSNLLHQPMASTSPPSPQEASPHGPSHVRTVLPARAV